MSIQKQIDDIEYPPTHTYRIDTLHPGPVLAERLAIIERLCPDLFDGNSFLDVGANKGYFSLRACEKAKTVIAIEPDPDCAALLRKISPHNMRVFEGSFGAFRDPMMFDRIFIGNGPHYLFRESCGWDWVRRLAALSNGKVVLEGPKDMACEDMTRCIPDDLRPLFTWEYFWGAADGLFTIAAQEPSISHTPDRYVTVLHRVEDPVQQPGKVVTEYLQHIYMLMSDWIVGNVVVEICARHDRGRMTERILEVPLFVSVDRNPMRPGLTLDALRGNLPPCDTLISTAILHHTERKDIGPLLINLGRHTRGRMIFSGPNIKVMDTLQGDHLYHIDLDHLRPLIEEAGFTVIHVESVGFQEPKAELLVVCERDS